MKCAQKNCVFGNYIRNTLDPDIRNKLYVQLPRAGGSRGRRGKSIVRGASGELKSICLSVRRGCDIAARRKHRRYHDCGNGQDFSGPTRGFRNQHDGDSGGGTTGVIPRNEHIQLRFSLNSRKKSARPTRANFNVASLVVQRPSFLPFLSLHGPLFFFLLSFSSLIPATFLVKFPQIVTRVRKRICLASEFLIHSTYILIRFYIKNKEFY